MNQSRIAILVLLLIGILFVIGAGTGLRRRDEGPDIENMNPEQISEFVEKSIPEFFKTLQRSLGSQGPRLKAADFAFPRLSGAPSILEFTRREPLTALLRGAEADNRTGVFRLIAGSKAFLKYAPKNLPGGVEDPQAEGKLREQKLELMPASDPNAHCEKNDKSCVSISIFKDGGSLSFECAGDTPCRVEIK